MLQDRNAGASTANGSIGRIPLLPAKTLWKLRTASKKCCFQYPEQIAVLKKSLIARKNHFERWQQSIYILISLSLNYAITCIYLQVSWKNIISLEVTGCCFLEATDCCSEKITDCCFLEVTYCCPLENSGCWFQEVADCCLLENTGSCVLEVTDCCSLNIFGSC